jgi:hypothetical protein
MFFRDIFPKLISFPEYLFCRILSTNVLDILAHMVYVVLSYLLLLNDISEKIICILNLSDCCVLLRVLSCQKTAYQRGLIYEKSS